MENARIVCYGGGAGFVDFESALKMDHAEIIGVIDQRGSTGKYHSVQISQLRETAYDYVVICSARYRSEMMENLLNAQIPAEKILTAPNCFSLDERSYRVMRQLLKPEVRRGATYFLSPSLPVEDCYDPVRSALLSLIAEMQKGRNVDGSMAEVGVFRGDFSRQMSVLFPERDIWLFDTFESFDKRDMENDPTPERYQNLKYQHFQQTSVEMVLDRMPFRDKCVVRKGYFPETAQDMPSEVRFSLVSLDADLYQPTFSGLEFFYPRLSPGGVILIHDYNSHAWPGVTRAVDEFALSHTLYPIPIPDNEGSALLIRQ